MSPVDRELQIVEGGLAKYVSGRRWFRGKARTMAGCSLVGAVPLPIEGERAWVAIARVRYADGGDEEYALPLLIADASRAGELRKGRPHLVVADRPDGSAVVDALGDARVSRALLGLIARGAVVRDGASVLRFRRLASALHEAGAEPRPIEAEQSNTSVVFGDAYVLKLIRKLDEGVSADLEMGEFLTAAGYAHAPAVEGAVDLAREGGEPATLGILHRFVPNQGDAWSFFLERVARSLDGARADRTGDVLGDDRARLRLLAARVADMHVALGSRPDLPAFAPEPIAKDERARLADAVRASMRSIPALEGRRAALEGRLASFVEEGAAAQKTRVHGDLHLGQVLVSGDDFVLIDFEGEPARPLAERKSKRSPLADVAGMLRSLHYAAMSAARAHAQRGPEIEGAARAWQRAAHAAFLEAYFEGMKGEGTRATSLLPAREEDARRMLDFYLLEKCVYEVHYEMNNRPDWLAIPMEGLAQLIEGHDAP